MADLRLVQSIDDNNPDFNDIYLENGTVRLTRTLIEEVAQRIRVSLLMFKGEWFLDPSQGIPYWQNILGHKAPLSQISRIFRSAVQQQPGVKVITAFAVKRLPTRRIQVTFACTLQDGTTLVSSDFSPFVVGA